MAIAQYRAFVADSVGPPVAILDQALLWSIVGTAIFVALMCALLGMASVAQAYRTRTQRHQDAIARFRSVLEANSFIPSRNDPEFNRLITWYLGKLRRTGAVCWLSDLYYRHGRYGTSSAGQVVEAGVGTRIGFFIVGPLDDLSRPLTDFRDVYQVARFLLQDEPLLRTDLKDVFNHNRISVVRKGKGFVIDLDVEDVMRASFEADITHLLGVLDT